ncbi:hypothetical protein fugu_002624 [Takifugu bimaculatus]|uniref:Uncharacterized protein n=1 Tax=Takifugu bimaculatus TaxID=433685 RepID=A0A4Z2BDR2_9TELE|nr:hypothetical protein fugu_002624 [Takifugu bimaculatus]
MRARVIFPPEKIRLFRPTKGKEKQRIKSASVEKAAVLQADGRFYFFNHLCDGDPPCQGSTVQAELCNPKLYFTNAKTFWGKTRIRMQIFAHVNDVKENPVSLGVIFVLILITAGGHQCFGLCLLNLIIKKGKIPFFRQKHPIRSHKCVWTVQSVDVLTDSVH